MLYDNPLLLSAFITTLTFSRQVEIRYKRLITGIFKNQAFYVSREEGVPALSADVFQDHQITYSGALDWFTTAIGLID